MSHREKEVKGDKIWRTAALLLLCGLVYFFSYDHGRRSLKLQFDKYKLEAASLLDSQRLEILNLHTALANCRAQVGQQAVAVENITLKVNQSRLLFDGRLVLTLLRVDSADNKALVQLNFLEEEKLVQEEIPTGGSLRFGLDGGGWTLLLNSLSLSSANFNFLESLESKE
jgi:hypothetical protein